MEAFPTSIIQAFPFIRKPEFVIGVVNYENQKEQRLLRTPNPRYTYKANWDSLTPAEKQVIQDFFVARRGNIDPFLYTDPDPDSATYGQQLTVRFVEASHNFTYFRFMLWDCSSLEMRDA